jgi:hypothetical protein
VSIYPVMPPGTCRESSWILAACYPELEYAEGHRTLILNFPDDRVIRDRIEHAWNVTPDGEIVDATMHPDLAHAAVEYEISDPATWWPASVGDAAEEMAAAARSQTDGRNPDERRQIVEAFGRMFRLDKARLG